MIAVIGGTGTTGREVVTGLEAAGAAFRCIVRDERAAGLLGDDVGRSADDARLVVYRLSAWQRRVERSG